MRIGTRLTRNPLYLAFAAERAQTSPRFTLHDRIEDVDSHQIRTLFEIAESIDGQYIVAMLEEKACLADRELASTCSILRLSRSDRFLRIEQGTDAPDESDVQRSRGTTFGSS